MKKVILIVFGLTVAAIALIITIFYEYKEVPDVKWRKSYLPADKEPHGTWILRNLLIEKYGEDNVLDRYRDIQIEEINEEENCLLIMIGERLNLNYDETDALANFSNAGNDILMIGNFVDFDYDWGLVDWDTRFQSDTFLTVTYPSVSPEAFRFKFRDGSLTESNKTYYRSFINGSLLTNAENPDSLVELKNIGPEGFEVLKEKFTEDGEIIENDIEEIIDIEEDEEVDTGYTLGINQDSASIYKEWNFGGEFVGIHLLPDMFTNIASKQPYFLDHFNALIGQYNYDKVIFEHPSFNLDKGIDRESPIQFILGNTSLKWSYYTLLIGALLYVIFRGKRKQRIVPTLAPNNNTSLEYVQTLGSLYEHQNQPRKLVKHMGDIFYHDVKSRYFLDHHDPKYIQKLSKKSNISEQEINTIVKSFSTIEGRFDFTDVDLSNLYRRLDAFYKNCK